MRIIAQYEPIVKKFKDETGLTDSDIEGWLVAEREHLEALHSEPEEDTLAIEYVRALGELWKAE